VKAPAAGAIVAPAAPSATSARGSPRAGSRSLAAAARALTLSRLVALPLFLWLIATAHATGAHRLALVALYGALAASDALDGRLARAAGAASARWGLVDVAADVVFNAASLGVAAALGLVGAWVPAGVVVLGGRFLLRAGRAGAARPPADCAEAAGPRAVEDRAGKVAGVLYYVLVGLVVAEIAVGVPPPAVVRRLGDAVFLYTLGVLAARRGKRGHS
jgi:phosphatidylglycerophosphate synthase